MIGFTAFTAVLQASCNESNRMAGIDGSGGPLFAQGPIEAFGSIVVSGERYDVSGAVIRINGEPATEGELEIGQVVSVEAYQRADGDRVADAVAFEANLRGPVQLIDAPNGTLVSMEQEIDVGPGAVVDLDSGNDLDSLQIGDYVEVSGFVEADGRIAATRVASVAATSEIRLIGRIDQVDIASFSFLIGDLLVDYSNVALIEGFPAGSPMNGDEVLAVGDAVSGSGVFIASRLSLIEPDSSGRNGERAEVEGLITRFVSPSDFDVAGKRSTATADTVYEGGTAASLGLNVKIQIEGHFDSSGTIVADKIEVKDGGAVSD